MGEFMLQCSITSTEKTKRILEDLEFSIQTFQNLGLWLMSMDIQLNLPKIYVYGKLNSVIFTIQLS